ncbi:hypothetical protein V8E55_009167 [Tylopilus felleus]
MHLHRYCKRSALVGVEVSERQEFRHSFSKEGSSRSQGNDLNPEWMDEKPAHFTPMCNVVANPSELAHSLQPKMAPDGIQCYPAFWPDRIEGADKLEAQGSSFIVPVSSKPDHLLLYYLFMAWKREKVYVGGCNCKVCGA